MGCWEEIDVASTSTISARWGAEGFVEFTMECNAAVTAFSCAYMYNQVVEKLLTLYQKEERKGLERLGDWVRRDALLACVSTLFCVFGERVPANYMLAPLRPARRIRWQGGRRSCE